MQEIVERDRPWKLSRNRAFFGGWPFPSTMWSETLEGDIEQFEADLALNVVEYHCEKRHRPEYAKRIVNVLRGLAEQIESVELQMARDGHK